MWHGGASPALAFENILPWYTLAMTDSDMYDSHVLRKVGEVLAFTQVGLDTFDRGQEALMRVFEEQEMDRILEQKNKALEQMESFLQHIDDAQSVQDKAALTSAKLVNMRDLYLQDEWSDHLEILEWLGFFEGAAIVHWGLIGGYTSARYVPELSNLASEMLEFHRTLLERVTALLIESGASY